MSRPVGPDPGLRAIVLPHPPLIVPDLTGPGAVEAEPVRLACAAAVADLLAAGRPALVVVGVGARTTRHPLGAWGSLAGYGVAVESPRGGAERGRAGRGRGPELPLSLTIGCYVLDAAGGPPAVTGEVELVEIAESADPAECRRTGADLVARRPDAGWLVLGDGTTKRTERAPGAFDARAETFDDEVQAALAAGSPDGLLALDVALAADLGAAGRSAWQVLAGAWEALHGRTEATAKIDYAGAPFGVGYVVARWSDPD